MRDRVPSVLLFPRRLGVRYFGNKTVSSDGYEPSGVDGKLFLGDLVGSAILLTFYHSVLGPVARVWCFTLSLLSPFPFS